MPPTSGAFQSWEESKGSVIFNGAGKAKHADAVMEIEHELLCRVDFTDTIE